MFVEDLGIRDCIPCHLIWVLDHIPTLQVAVRPIGLVTAILPSELFVEALISLVATRKRARLGLLPAFSALVMAETSQKGAREGTQGRQLVAGIGSLSEEPPEISPKCLVSRAAEMIGRRHRGHGAPGLPNRHSDLPMTCLRSVGAALWAPSRHPDAPRPRPQIVGRRGASPERPRLEINLRELRAELPPAFGPCPGPPTAASRLRRACHPAPAHSRPSIQGETLPAARQAELQQRLALLVSRVEVNHLRQRDDLLGGQRGH